MTKPRSLPNTASIAEQGNGAKLVAPSATRNAGDISALLADFAPAEGHALELASGTGQHMAVFAAAIPGLHWQPTDVEAARLTSIDAYAASSGVTNIAPARHLNATAPGWAAKETGKALIVVVNLLHLISQAEADCLITEAAQALAPDGRLVIYGPFMRAGELTSPGDESFHASLTGHDPEIGYKDDFDTLDRLQAAGLKILAVVEMPANNLALVTEKPAI